MTAPPVLSFQTIVGALLEVPPGATEVWRSYRNKIGSVTRSSRIFGVLLLHVHSHEHHVKLNQRGSVQVKMAEIEILMVRLRNQGLEVLKFGYACIRLTGVYNPPVSDEDGITLMKYAFSKGITFFDTSNIYGDEAMLMNYRWERYYGRDYHGIQTRWEISITKIVLPCYSWPMQIKRYPNCSVCCNELAALRKVNLLFSTDVVEEGIYVPNCSFVIQFDLPKTVRSYIQSHGRARQNYSQFVLMLERGNIKQRDQIFDIIRSEYSMTDTVGNRDPDSCILRACKIKETDAYYVDATGASVTADSSVNLIHRYCEKLTRDKYGHVFFVIPLSRTVVLCGNILLPLSFSQS